MQTPIPAIPNLPATPDLLTQLSPGAAPLVLFPVRLETRFFSLPAGGFELRVRVYPDTLHIDSHEPGLTPEELRWGRHFWEQSWRAAGDDERARAAWRQLADRFDAPRAAWVARALRPLNPDDRPDDPVPAEAALDTPPRFPDPPTKDESWTRPPLARALPARWIVLGYRGGRLVFNVTGGPIRAALQAGPDPKADSATSDPDRPAIDDGMRWLVDFEEAEQAGMGIRARLTVDQAHAGLDFVLVLGIQDAPGDTTAARARLAELLDAHHYTGGLSFVPQGTPSNNTREAPSGFSSNDPGHATSYLAERGGPALEVGDGSNADLLGTALGLEGQAFANLPHAMESEQRDARHMNAVLWQATWGYYLLQMLGTGASGESPLTDDDIDWAREHFVEYVRPGGPLPALRIGKQPYGVLPVTSLDAWKPRSGQASPDREAALRDLLMRLRDLWRRNFDEVPRLGRSPDSTTERGFDRDLSEVLSLDGLSSTYAIRGLIGRHYLEHLGVFLSADFYLDAWHSTEPEPPPVEEPPEEEEPPDDLTPRERIAWIKAQREARLAWIREQEAKQRAYAAAHRAWLEMRNNRRRALDEWWATQQQQAGTLLQTLGVTWRPRLAHAVYMPPVAPLGGALVQAEGETAADYIGALLAARSLTSLRHQTGQPRTLLQLLVKHSMLLEYVAAGSRLLLRRGLLRPEQRREAELVDLPLGQLTRTPWRQLTFKIGVDGEAEQIEVGNYLLGYLPSGEPDTGREPRLQPLSDFRAGLRHLQSLKIPRLEQLLAGTLDACSHRLDAWITSLATRRLAELRQERPDDVLFGGYGWVVNLRPSATHAEVAPPPGEQAPLFGAAGNPGFIHAPSLAQATTAAVLRSGHLAHVDDETPNQALAIDLSSERVRLASWLLDGVRQGQPLGALLGYRFERRLQEAGKAIFIDYFRDLAPLVARKREPGTQPVEAIAANNVVDGLDLQRRWLAVKDAPAPGDNPLVALFDPLQDKPKPDELNAARSVLEAELNTLADAVDAVSDALMAETVFQVVRGSPLRATATVEAIAGGETPPPELDVVRTPRSGTALTQRLVTLWSGEPELPAHWPSPAGSMRAEAEPWLNTWAARLLGDPARVRCVVERLDPAGGQVVETKELRLDRLGLAPLDYIYAVEGGTGGQQAEIEQRLLYTQHAHAGRLRAGLDATHRRGAQPRLGCRRAGIRRIQRAAAHGPPSDHRRACAGRRRPGLTPAQYGFQRRPGRAGTARGYRRAALAGSGRSARGAAGRARRGRARAAARIDGAGGRLRRSRRCTACGRRRLDRRSPDAAGTGRLDPHRAGAARRTARSAGRKRELRHGDGGNQARSCAGTAARRVRQNLCGAAPVYGSQCRGARAGAGRQHNPAGRRSLRRADLVPAHGARARRRCPAQRRAELRRSAQQRRAARVEHRAAAARRQHTLGRVAAGSRTQAAGRCSFAGRPILHVA